ncbi:C-type lectin-like isoform X3 [Palaemon carinicauda]|uniref:C-type lectin-like isoform X3 n=2 Tax=Palaemon carinicauda TaxID=392227 RepID=UPI0035B61CC7
MRINGDAPVKQFLFYENAPRRLTGFSIVLQNLFAKMKMMLFFLELLGAFGFVRLAPASERQMSCPVPFITIGGQCILIDELNSGSWYDMKHMCEQLHGQLVNLDDANLYYEIVHYIYEHKLSSVHYWIGASKDNSLGTWQWPDGTAVKMGTPYWANFGKDEKQAPDGGDREKCALLSASFHYYIQDDPCDLMRGVICEYPM